MRWQLLSWVAQTKHELCLEEEDATRSKTLRAGLGASCRGPGSAREAVALLYAEVPTPAQTHFPLWMVSTRTALAADTLKESAKGARCALAQINWVALLEKRIHKLKSSVMSALQTI